jgi:hypothetical protein
VNAHVGSRCNWPVNIDGKHRRRFLCEERVLDPLCPSGDKFPSSRLERGTTRGTGTGSAFPASIRAAIDARRGQVDTRFIARAIREDVSSISRSQRSLKSETIVKSSRAVPSCPPSCAYSHTRRHATCADCYLLSSVPSTTARSLCSISVSRLHYSQ